MTIELDVKEDRTLCIRKCYSGVLLETAEGNQIGVCMRDDTFEINVLPQGRDTGNWWRVDMANGKIKSLTPPQEQGGLVALREVARIAGMMDGFHEARRFPEGDVVVVSALDWRALQASLAALTDEPAKPANSRFIGERVGGPEVREELAKPKPEPVEDAGDGRLESDLLKVSATLKSHDDLSKRLSDVQESKWVSVAERLPANAQEVWCVVQLQDGERERLVRRATYFEGTGWFKLGFDANLVTHWQSQFTPQPPKPEEKPL